MLRERTIAELAASALPLSSFWDSSEASGAKIERPRNNRTKTLIDLIVDCLPRDREFDLNALAGWLKEADPTRSPSVNVIRRNIHRLMRQGVLKRTQRSDGKTRVLFAVVSLEVTREPTVRELVEKFTGQTSDPVEVMCLMLDSGWRPDGDGTRVLDRVKRVMGLA